MTTPVKQVGVFLSSSLRVAPTFLAEAEALGHELAKNGFTVVYGGCNSGCMGRLADGVLEARGRLVGVIPEMDFMAGLVQEGLSEKIIVRDLSSRKGALTSNADAFVVFPGGLGTLDEIAEVLALRQIGSHQKPVIFYNYLGYWTAFIECLETFSQQGMIAGPIEELFVVLDQPTNVINYLKCAQN
jgi:cytokinin riboside 5'-monophosphate phosphoribohydrolase